MVTPALHRSSQAAQLRAEIASLEKDWDFEAHRDCVSRIRSAYRFEKIGRKAVGVSLGLVAAGLVAAPFAGSAARALLCMVPGAALLGGGLWLLCSAQDRGGEYRLRAQDIYSRRHRDFDRLESLRHQLKQLQA